MKIIHIDASPRASRSRSRTVANHFIEALEDDISIEHCDIWQCALPDLGGDMIEGRYNLIMGETVDAAITNQWNEIRRFTEHVLAHDAIVFSVPMWNFGIPYRLKQFIDVITQPGMAFSNDAEGNVVGLAAGKRSLVIASSAMPFGHDASLDHLDFQVSYLERWLGFIGVTDIDTVRIAPTFGAPDQVDKVVAEACRKADKVARIWAKK